MKKKCVFFAFAIKKFVFFLEKPRFCPPKRHFFRQKMIYCYIF